MTENDWRDWEPGRTGISVAQLSDGESVQAQIVGEPYRDETSESDDALHVPVQFVGDIPDEFRDMSGDPVDNEEEYNIINSSSTFFNALVGAFSEGTDLNGQMVDITARQPDDQYSRSYEVEAI